MKKQFLITVTLRKDVENLIDLVAGRAYTIDGVTDVEAAVAQNEPCIKLTPHEIQSGHDRVLWAEGLILQLPEWHDGRNSWLINYGISVESEEKRTNWSQQSGKPYPITPDSLLDEVRYKLPPLKLTGYQLRDALVFIAPDEIDEQLEQVACIAERNSVKDEDGDSTLPPGLFVWLDEYPEEGLLPLDGEPLIKSERTQDDPVDRLSSECLQQLKLQAIEHHNGEWLHHWGRMIEAEVLKRLGRS